ncbi:glycoside hydrolase family 25 protein [Streptomyces rhizosphaerihabitans]|uniref:glycoside hydrolase family 25 protein n=1 Tax=Streptomyces rhizosphaerihabitans TaxID=1266770 RepID=UPI0021C01CCA|nr:glycoside hydrolase family 25 protein [Streptomyces rhizosphaerihabitans]MCT9003524.1 glycoside hydrolase family 25 protein [Streptomyces rhizosphaerihabitans]
MTVRGVDVASYQATDYSTRGLDFAFIKITEGTTYTNPKWVAERKTARDAGLVTGFYHFIRPGNVTKQADYFLSKITLRTGDILALDWEDPAVSCAQKDAWIRYVQKKAPSHRVILYCNYDFWTNRETTSFAGDGLWIAHYNGKPGNPGIKASWRFHQYTSTPIDTNIGNFADKAALRTWAETSSSGTGPTPKPRPSKPAYVPPAFPARLAPGKSTPSAKPLQKALRAARFLNIEEADLSATYGPRTQAGVRRFFDAYPQFRAKGKPHDAAIGPHGWAFLFTLAYGRK